MSDRPVSPSAADTFSLLSDETRVEIVRALGDNRERDPENRSFVPISEERPSKLSYSTLKESADIQDNGRMNYHLNKLLGTLVRDVTDGYQLTWLGYLTYRFLIAGFFEWSEYWRVELDDARCGHCQSPYSAEYGPYQFLRVGCLACADYYVGVHFPARGLATRTIDESVTAADQKMRWQFALLEHGVCPWCGGVVEQQLDQVAETDVLIAGSSFFVTYSCQTCGNVRYNSVGSHLLVHPEVIGFYAAQDRSLWEIRTWEIEFLDDDHVTVQSSEPLVVTVTIALAGEQLRLTIEDDLTITDVERSTAYS